MLNPSQNTRNARCRQTGICCVVLWLVSHERFLTHGSGWSWLQLSWPEETFDKSQGLHSHCYTNGKPPPQSLCHCVPFPKVGQFFPLVLMKLRLVTWVSHCACEQIPDTWWLMLSRSQDHWNLLQGSGLAPVSRSQTWAGHARAVGLAARMQPGPGWGQEKQQLCNGIPLLCVLQHRWARMKAIAPSL